jgi:5-amino-6-(5-phosphoribosylamino)uracil reductase
MIQAFELLFDQTAHGISLPDDIRNIYQGDWVLPDKQLYTYSNFVISRDGRISFNEPGHLGGGDVSAFNPYDRWLMALLRARAEAVIVGDNTLRLEPEHLWTHDYIYPEHTEPFTRLRHQEGLSSQPIQIFLSQEGNLYHDAAVFTKDVEIIIATTSRGAEKAKALQSKARLHVLELGEEWVDLQLLANILQHDFDIKRLLCEGGPRAYGSLIKARLIDEEFLTLSPTVLGNSTPARPGLIEGVSFSPTHYPLSKPISLRRAGDHLFLRSRYVYP